MPGRVRAVVRSGVSVRPAAAVTMLATARASSRRAAASTSERDKRALSAAVLVMASLRYRRSRGLAQVAELVQIVGGAGIRAVPLGQDGAEFAGDHEQAGNRQPLPGEGALAVVDGGLEVAVAGGDDAEGDAGFGVAHRGEFGAGGVGAEADDFAGVGLGESSRCWPRVSCRSSMAVMRRSHARPSTRSCCAGRCA